MKIFNKMIVLASATLAQNDDSNTNSTTSIGRFGGGNKPGGMGLGRRYTDLLKLVKHYTPEFDERKYWAYGCNCLILGDRPMSDPGHGRPVDALDMICKQYKVFQKYILDVIYMISTNACLYEVVGESINFFFRIAKNVSAENTVTNVLASLSSTTGASAVANQNVQTSQVHANEIFANVIWTLHERCLHNMKFLM